MFPRWQLYPENVIHQNWNASQEPVHVGKMKKLELFKINHYHHTQPPPAPPKQLWKEVFLFCEWLTLICFVSSRDNKIRNIKHTHARSISWPGLFTTFIQWSLNVLWLSRCLAFTRYSEGCKKSSLESWLLLGCQAEFLPAVTVSMGGGWGVCLWCLTYYILLFSVLWTASRALPWRFGAFCFLLFLK